MLKPDQLARAVLEDDEPISADDVKRYAMKYVKPQLYTVVLSSGGNEDFGEDPNEAQSPTQRVKVKTFKEASQVCLKYIVDHNLGSGQWYAGVKAGMVYDRDGKPVARVSYNGRVWVVTAAGNEIPT